MTLEIRTFDNKSRSGDALFKALGHPAVAPKVRDWIAQASTLGNLAVVDPWGQFSCLAALYDLSALNIESRYVQRIEDFDQPNVKLLLDLPSSSAKAVLLAAFDDGAARRAISHLLPQGVSIISFDDLRLEDRYVTNKRRYLDPLNFATNFALFRAGNGRHSIVRSAEYWTGYGAAAPSLWLTLLDSDGTQIAQWVEPLRAKQSIVLDAAEIRERFALAPFDGMLLIHAIGIAGHDQIKYVLDDIDDQARDPAVTHDSNAWPAMYYSGLPAPRPNESVHLWLQNPHPSPIPAGTIRLNPIGTDNHAFIQTEIAGFGTCRLNIAELFAHVEWPMQIEAMTGQHTIRPRYEIITRHLDSETVTFAHMNVERTDLKPDPEITKASPLLGKGYILPAPILPINEWRNLALPTPAATGQAALPLLLLIYSKDGELVVKQTLGVFARDQVPQLDLNAILTEAGVTDPGFAGHMELIYDFAAEIDVDGWLHGLFRYENIASGQMGDTSFGAHIFNIPITFRDEPQSYAGRPPGLSSRLFARLGPYPLDAFMHLTYPCSGDWHKISDTVVTLYNGNGEPINEYRLSIPINGSRFVSAAGMFTLGELQGAGEKGYMIIDDRTCRLFGYHGLTGPAGQFNLDHMFGF